MQVFEPELVPKNHSLTPSNSLTSKVNPWIMSSQDAIQFTSNLLVQLGGGVCFWSHHAGQG